jgi:hypothetical protein
MQRAVVRLLPFFVLCFLTPHIGAQERINCAPGGAGFRCRIDELNVTHCGSASN